MVKKKPLAATQDCFKMCPRMLAAWSRERETRRERWGIGDHLVAFVCEIKQQAEQNRAKNHRYMIRFKGIEG